MRYYQESSGIQWEKTRLTMDAVSRPVLELFAKYPGSTVDEIHRHFITIYGNIPRNEFAKRVSYLCCEKDRLTDLGPKQCTVTGKRLVHWEVNKNPRKIIKKSRDSIISAQARRIVYLESVLTSNNIPFEKEYDDDAQIDMFR